MKKLLAIVLTLALLLSLGACGGGNDPQGAEDPPQEETQEPAQPTAGQDPDEPEGGGTQDPVDEPPAESGGDNGETEEPSEEPGEAGGSEDPAVPDDEPEGDTPDDKQTETESQTSTQPAPEDETPPQVEEDPPLTKKAIAENLIGHPVSELYAAIGEPISSEYSPSCLDLETDDGELTYDGFVVYTEGAPDNEVVYDVF